MAYKTESPTKSRRSLTRASANSRGYSSVLSGFSSSLNDVRKTLLSEALSRINYEIEVNASSNEDKLNLYENYLENLTPGTSEYYDTALKIQNLRDSLSTEDFNYAKALYSGNQISAEEYYRILKERVNEDDLSDKERTQRTLDLWDFERKVKNNATDDALREAALQESQGIISAFDRLSVIQAAYDAETDPDRKQTLKGQLIAQRDASVKENQSYRELIIRKGIQEGTATKSDLLALYAEKYQTAKTPNDALQAEISLQNLLKEVTADNSKMFKKEVKDIVAVLDNKIEQARRDGDVTALKLLYDNKAGVIQQFFNSEDVSLEDKESSSTFFTFLKETYGKDYDIDSGTVIDVAPTAENNIEIVEEALHNPDSSLIVRTFSPSGIGTNKIVRGEKTTITKPDGTIENFYDFGKNVAVSRIDTSLTKEAIDPITGQVLKDEQGNPIRVGATPSGRELKSLPDNYGDVLQVGNLKPLSANEFKGEYVDLYKDSGGNMVRGYKVYGERFKNTLGAQPVAGENNAFLLTTKDNQIPNQKYVKEQELYRPTIKNIVEGIPKGVVNTIKSAFTPSSQVQRDTLAMQGIGDIANDVSNTIKKIDFSGLTQGIQNNVSDIKIPEVKLPDFSKNFANIESDIQRQLLSSVFKPNVVLNTVSGNYTRAITGAVTNFVRNSPLGNNFMNSVGNFFSGALNTVRNWFGGN